MTAFLSIAGSPERDSLPLCPTGRGAWRSWLAASVVLAWAVCSLACKSGSGKQAVIAPETEAGPPAFPGGFTPGPPLPDPPPPEPGKRGLSYLQKLYSRLVEPWHTFLENCRLRLPPEHALNQAELALLMELTIDKQGALHSLSMVQKSGNPDFDEAAAEIVRDAAPFPEPPFHLVSDDDMVHIRWLFARDRRQAGLATAEVEVVRWPVARVVPKLLASKQITRAAERMAEALDAGEAASWIELGHDVAVAAIREAMRSKDVAVQRVAVVAAARAKVVDVAPELRALVDTAVDARVRGQAIKAIGMIGDQGAGPLLVGVLETAKGSGVGGHEDSSVAAARALAAIGQAPLAEATIKSWLLAEDDESRWAALVVMSEFGVSAAVPMLVDMAGDRARSREERMAACAGLGAAAGADRAVSGAAMKALRKHFTEADAAVRAACVNAVARAARAGVRSRAAYWKLVELVKKERDERVRAAAVRAAAYLEPGRFAQELFVLRRENSPQVLAALAQALARVPDALAYKKLVSLAGHEDSMVRRRAAESLAEHADGRAARALAKMVTDADFEVRLVAIRAVDDAAALDGMLSDPAAQVRAAAFAALVRKQGKRATLLRMLREIAQAAPASAERARWAMAWLIP